MKWNDAGLSMECQQVNSAQLCSAQLSSRGTGLEVVWYSKQWNEMSVRRICNMSCLTDCWAEERRKEFIDILSPELMQRGFAHLFPFESRPPWIYDNSEMAIKLVESVKMINRRSPSGVRYRSAAKARLHSYGSSDSNGGSQQHSLN